MNQHLNEIVEAAVKHRYFSRAALLENIPQESWEVLKLWLKLDGSDRVIDEIREQYLRRINWPASPHKVYPLEISPRLLGTTNQVFDGLMNRGVLPKEIKSIDGTSLVTVHDLVRAALWPKRKICGSTEISREYAIKLPAVYGLSKMGILGPDVSHLDAIAFFNLMFPAYGTEEWIKLARLSMYPPTKLSGIGYFWHIPSFDRNVAIANPIITTELKSEAVKEPEPSQAPSAPKIKSTTLREILSELELKRPAYILQSEFPFEPRFDFAYAPYSREQNPDAFYVRSPNFVQIGKQWVEPKIKWDDAYRLYLAKSYATRDALKLEFGKNKIEYQEDDLRTKLEAARMGTIVYNKTEVFPHVACDIAVMEMDDVQRIGYLVEPVVKKLGPFIPMSLINILLGSGLVMMPDDQIAKIDVKGEAYLSFFQVVKSHESEFTPVLTRF